MSDDDEEKLELYLSLIDALEEKLEEFSRRVGLMGFCKHGVKRIDTCMLCVKDIGGAYRSSNN